MKLKHLFLLPVLAVTANAATVISGNGSASDPLIIQGIIGQPNVTAVFTFTAQAGNTAFVPSGTTSFPYDNLDNHIRLDGTGGAATIAFFTNFNPATNLGDAIDFTGQLNFFDVDSFDNGSDQVTLIADVVNSLVLAPLTNEIDNANDRQGFIAAGLVTAQLVDTSVVTVENTGTGTIILDIESFGQSIPVLQPVPEPSSAAILGLGSLALLTRRRR